MIRFVCDTPDRVPARIYRALAVECQCCTFWRGVLLGVAVGFAFAGGTMLLAG